MKVPIKLIKMSQTFAENNNDAEENKNECCICYNDDSEEGNEGKLIECCPNKHLLCVKCFHESYKRNCECPLCCELMFRPEIMTDVESFAYYGAKLALKQKEREEQQRQIRLAEAERQRVEAERQREIRLERQREIRLAEAEMPAEERQRAIAALNDRRARGLIRLAEAERQRDDRYARAREERQRQEQPQEQRQDQEQIHQLDQEQIHQLNEMQREMLRRMEANEDEDVTRDYFNSYMDSWWHRAQQPVARPVQPVARPVTQAERIIQLLGTRPVQQPARPVQIPRHERPVQERRSSTYAYNKLVQNELLVQTLRDQRMVVRYDRLNDRFIRVSDNTVYPTLNRASVAHALEVGLATSPNPWTTFKRLNGSSIDNL